MENNSPIYNSNMIQIELMMDYEQKTGFSIEDWIQNFSAKFREIWNKNPDIEKEEITQLLYLSSSVKNDVNIILL